MSDNTSFIQEGEKLQEGSPDAPSSPQGGEAQASARGATALLHPSAQPENTHSHAEETGVAQAPPLVPHLQEDIRVPTQSVMTQTEEGRVEVELSQLRFLARKLDQVMMGIRAIERRLDLASVSHLSSFSAQGVAKNSTLASHRSAATSEHEGLDATMFANLTLAPSPVSPTSPASAASAWSAWSAASAASVAPAASATQVTTPGAFVLQRNATAHALSQGPEASSTEVPQASNLTNSTFLNVSRMELTAEDNINLAKQPHRAQHRAVAADSGATAASGGVMPYSTKKTSWRTRYFSPGSPAKGTGGNAAKSRCGEATGTGNSGAERKGARPRRKPCPICAHLGHKYNYHKLEECWYYSAEAKCKQKANRE